MRRLGALVLLFTVAAIDAVAQEEPTTGFRSKVQLRWDLIFRYDEVNDFPHRIAPGVDSISYDHTHLQFRPGLLYTPNEMLTVEARAVVHEDSKDDDFFALADHGDGYYKQIGLHDHFAYSGRQDNYDPNGVAIDRLNLQLRPTEGTLLLVGKFQNPFDTTEAIWDSDLQPEGVAGSIDFGAFDALHSRVTAGGYFGTQLYGDESVIAAGQYTLAGSTTAPVTWSASLGYFDFDDLDVLARRNWRQNHTVIENGWRRFVSDFEIGQLLVRIGSDRFLAPMQLHYEQLHNFGAAFDSEDDGWEAGLRFGPTGGPAPLRFTYIYQDLQRDSVMAGFNGDDWYIHSWYRGSLYRLGVNVWRDWEVRATFVDMEHHETTFTTTRWMFEVAKRY